MFKNLYINGTVRAIGYRLKGDRIRGRRLVFFLFFDFYKKI